MWISTWRLSEVQTFINLSWWDNIIYHFIRLLHSQWISSWTTREREITKTRKIEKTLLIITYQWNWSENRIISFFIRWDGIKLMWRVTFLGIQTPSAAIEASYRGKIQYIPTKKSHLLYWGKGCYGGWVPIVFKPPVPKLETPSDYLIWSCKKMKIFL